MDGSSSIGSVRRSKRLLGNVSTLQYDAKYHPMDASIRPAGAAKRRKLHGLASEHDSELDEAESPDDSNEDEGSNDGEPDSRSRTIKPRETRHSARLSTQEQVIYSNKVHPQDKQLREAGVFGRSRKNPYKIVDDDDENSSDEPVAGMDEPMHMDSSHGPPSGQKSQPQQTLSDSGLVANTKPIRKQRTHIRPNTGHISATVRFSREGHAVTRYPTKTESIEAHVKDYTLAWESLVTESLSMSERFAATAIQDSEKTSHQRWSPSTNEMSGAVNPLQHASEYSSSNVWVSPWEPIEGASVTRGQIDGCESEKKLPGQRLLAVVLPASIIHVHNTSSPSSSFSAMRTHSTTTKNPNFTIYDDAAKKTLHRPGKLQSSHTASQSVYAPSVEHPIGNISSSENHPQNQSASPERVRTSNSLLSSRPSKSNSAALSSTDEVDIEDWVMSTTQLQKDMQVTESSQFAEEIRALEESKLERRNTSPEL